jgi:hypothetical protein
VVSESRYGPINASIGRWVLYEAHIGGHLECGQTPFRFRLSLVPTIERSTHISFHLLLRSNQDQTPPHSSFISGQFTTSGQHCYLTRLPSHPTTPSPDPTTSSHTTGFENPDLPRPYLKLQPPLYLSIGNPNHKKTLAATPTIGDRNPENPKREPPIQPLSALV